MNGPLEFWMLLHEYRKVKMSSDEQHAIFGRELQSALKLTVGILEILLCNVTVALPGILFGGGVSTNSVEERENGGLGAVFP